MQYFNPHSLLSSMYLLHFYHLPTKLQEGIVFNRIFLIFYSQVGGVPCDNYPWCNIPHHVGTLPSPVDMKPHCAGTPSPPPVLVTRTGDLLKLAHLRTPPPLALTSGGYWSTYSWQVTAMLSCVLIFSVVKVIWNVLWKEVFSKYPNLRTRVQASRGEAVVVIEAENLGAIVLNGYQDVTCNTDIKRH